MVVARVLAVLLVVAVIAVGFSTPTMAEEVPNGQVILSEVKYTPLPSAWKATFTSTGQITLQVPTDPDVAPNGEITMVGTIQTLATDTNLYEIDVATGTSTIVGATNRVGILGNVLGNAAAELDLLLGDYGAYGTIRFPPTGAYKKHITFEAELNSAGTYDQVARVRLLEAVGDATTLDDGVGTLLPDVSGRDPPDPNNLLPPPTSASHSSCTLTDSRVFLLAEKSFVNYASNWGDRMDSAFNAYKPSFDSNCIKLFRLQGYLTGSFTSERCGDYSSGPYAQGQFQDWLDSANIPNSYTNVDAYQLWVNRNLKNPGDGPNEAHCYGSAAVDKALRPGWSAAIRQANGHFASGVMEGGDFDYDFYDPDESAERTIISAHELAHTYGEQNHPGHCCNTKYRNEDCNIMKRGVDVDYQALYFTGESSTQMHNWFFHGTV